jgi:hypothetical protein
VDGEGGCEGKVLRGCWNGVPWTVFYFLVMENDLNELLELL